MTQWIHKHIEENNKKWEKEKWERKERAEQRLKAWERSAIFEKIRILLGKRKNKLSMERIEVNTEENWQAWRQNQKESEIDNC